MKFILALLTSTALISSAAAQTIQYAGQGVRVGPLVTAPNNRATFTSGAGTPPALAPDGQAWGAGSLYSSTTGTLYSYTGSAWVSGSGGGNTTFVQGGTTYSGSVLTLAGSGCTLAATGTLTCSGGSYTLPAATTSVLGGVTASTGINVSAGALSVAYGTAAGTAAQGNDSRITGALQAANNLSDLASASTARTNLGLGSMATASAGTYATIAGPAFTGTVTIPALTLSGITGSTQCLHVNAAGLVTGAGSDCGTVGGGMTSFTAGTGFGGVSITNGMTVNLIPATASALGGVKPDGITIANTAGAISVGTIPVASVTGALSATTAAATYAPLASPTFTGTPVVPGYVPTANIPAASGQLLGGSGTAGTAGVVTVGSGLSLSGGTLTASGAGYTLPAATASVLGGVMPDGVTILNTGGAISVAGTYASQAWVGAQGYLTSAPVTSVAAHTGAVTLTHGDLTDWNTATSAFTYTLPAATTSTRGGVRADGTTTTMSGDVISAVSSGSTIPAPPPMLGPHRTGAYYPSPAAAGASLSGNVIIAGRLYGWPIWVPAGGETLKSISFNQTAAGTAVQCNAGVFANNASGQPGAEVADAGQATTTGAIGAQTFSFAAGAGVTLSGPSWYWGALWCNAAPGTVTVVTAVTSIGSLGSALVGQTTAALGAAGGFASYYSTTNTTYTSGTGAMPGTFGTTGFSSNQLLLVFGY